MGDSMEYVPPPEVYYLGIDNGTQGLTALLVDASLDVVAQGEGTYDFVSGLPTGSYEQVPQEWDEALIEAMKDLCGKVDASVIAGIAAIGFSGQMHGEVLCGADGVAIGPARLWCDARNAEEGDELTNLFQIKVPKRSTAARFLWTVRNQPERAAKTKHITTPAGYHAYQLTGEFNLGMGEASGMFPIDTKKMDYDDAMLKQYDALIQAAAAKHGIQVPPMKELLPKVVLAGNDAGHLTEKGAKMLGLPSNINSSSLPIPVAAAEGDQPAALAGSLIGRAGTVSCSFGTSVCANFVGDTHNPFTRVTDGVDLFHGPDGAPIYMVWLRNGTTFFNAIVAQQAGVNSTDIFGQMVPLMLAAPADCDGLLALPFLDDEPGCGVANGGTGMLVGWSPDNVGKPGSACKAALLATMCNLKRGTDMLGSHGVPCTELVLTGGLAKTPECGQILADMFSRPVTVLPGAEEGCSWGAAVLARYRVYVRDADITPILDWPSFLETILPSKSAQRLQFQPHPENAKVYDQYYRRYSKLLALQPKLHEAVSLE